MLKSSTTVPHPQPYILTPSALPGCHAEVHVLTPHVHNLWTKKQCVCVRVRVCVCVCVCVRVCLPKRTRYAHVTRTLHTRYAHVTHTLHSQQLIPSITTAAALTMQSYMSLSMSQKAMVLSPTKAWS